MDETLRNILLVGSCIFLGFVILMVVLAYFAIQQAKRFLSMDVAELRQKLEATRKANAGLSREALLQKIIREESFKCGLIGAVTGIGGFITLPIALPIDILLSMRVQSAMVQFIAMMYDQNPDTSQEVKVQTYLVMSGGVEVTETTTQVIMKFVVRILGKSLSKLIPVIGAVVGFIVNYGMAQVMGNVAMRWYASRYPDRKAAITG